ncbi:hypothetical protein [Jannaschia seohaensis]|uniref:hypothetical protein n=1 Tax=Jannaschia seohaensis TaxID=475081 RepID=UPI000D6B02B1|nr:hypothetical protein [Jannaschia seohaensis]
MHTAFDGRFSHSLIVGLPAAAEISVLDVSGQWVHVPAGPLGDRPRALAERVAHLLRRVPEGVGTPF